MSVNLSKRTVQTILAAVVALVVSQAVSASAQTWTERVHVSVNAGYQATSNHFTDRFEFERYLETGSTSVEYPIKAGFTFDAGGGVRLWKNLGAGVAVSVFSRDDVAQTTSQFPHPFFFNQPREVTGDATGVKRSETAVHVQAMYLITTGGRLRFVLSGGPSFYSVTQDFVSEVRINEDYPFDTATFSSAQLEEGQGSKTAFNVGADVMWMFSRSVGAGGLIRFSRASVDLDAPGSRTVTVDAGGLFVGGGVRLVF
jgi:hypothetical protein